MPVYALDDRIVFPDPVLADPSGLLALGGDLSVERLLLAYTHGIFPWYSQGDPIMWWSPDPRLILNPDEIKISKSFRQVLRNTDYEICFDKNFPEVIRQCALAPRTDQEGTWITKEMEEAYINFHHEGYAHSVEIYHNDTLTGGLYGVSLGKVFFGESMFHIKSNASKIALFHLIEKVKKWEFQLIDAQVETGHMKRLGARLVSRKRFLILLNEALKFPTKRGMW